MVAESGVAAGVRRIEAVTGAGAVEWAQQQRASLVRLVSALHVHEDQAVETIGKLLADNKRLAREADAAQDEAGAGRRIAGGRRRGD